MSDGSMEYEYNFMMSHHGPQVYPGPPGPRTTRCPAEGAWRGRRPEWSEPNRPWGELRPVYPPVWHHHPLSAQRWSPHSGPQPSLIPTRPGESTHVHSHDTGLSSTSAYPNYPTPASAPMVLPQPVMHTPSFSRNTGPPATTEEGQASPNQVQTPTAQAVDGITSSLPPAAAPAPVLGIQANPSNREGQQQQASLPAVSRQAATVRLPPPSGHLHLDSRSSRHRLSSGRSGVPEGPRGDLNGAATDASAPPTSSSDDDSDFELGPRLHFLGYHHSTRQSQILRGQMTNKRVASKKAIQSLQDVDIATLSESEKTCVICYNDFGVASPEGVVETPLRLPKCKHVFGNQCIRKWLEESYSCPYCRDQLDSELARPSEALLRRALQAAGESDIYVSHSPTFRRMLQAYYGNDLGSSSERAQVSFRRRRDHEASHGGPSHRDGTTRGERRALPEDHNDAQRRQRPRHDALHSSRSSAVPTEPSFMAANRHSPPTSASQSQSLNRDHLPRLPSWQPNQQIDPSRRALPPQLPQPSSLHFSPNRGQQVQAPPSISSITPLPLMNLSYPHSASSLHNSQLPTVVPREDGYPHYLFQAMSTSNRDPGFPPGYLNPLHPPTSGPELPYPSFTPHQPASPLPGLPAFFQQLPSTAQFHGSPYPGTSQPPLNATQPDRNVGGQHNGLYFSS